MPQKWHHTTSLLFLVSLILAVICAVNACYDENQRYLEFNVNIPGSSWGQLYFKVTPTRQLKESKNIKIESGAGQNRLTLPLVRAEFKELLFHLSSLNGDASFSDFKVVNGHGTLLEKIPVSSVQTSSDSAYVMNGENLIVSSTASVQYADLEIPVRSQAVQVGNAAVLLTKYLLLYVPLFFASLYGISMVSRRFLVNGMERFAVALSHTPSNRTVWLQVTAVFLVILGARLWLIRAFGSDIPYYDQWLAEALNLYIPYFDGSISWIHWFQPHNEHRIFLTRVIMLPLLLINGYWDAQVQMVVNAVLYSAIGAMVFRMLLPSTTMRSAWAAAVITVFVLPFGWENTLSGFQVQFYLMIGLSLLIILLFPEAGFGTCRWCTCCLCSILAIFNIASGFFACLSVLSISAVEMIKRKTAVSRREMMPTVIFCILMVIFGAIMVPHVSAHDRLKAHSVGEFLLSFSRNLSWPLTDFPAWAIIQWLPLSLLLVRYLKSSRPLPQIRAISGIGLFVLLQVAAIAYARGGLSSWPESRYQDILSLGVLANAIALLYLLAKEDMIGRPAILRSLCVVWLVVNSAGFTYLSRSNFVHDLPGKRAYQQAGREIVRSFLATGNVDTLVAAPRNDLPYHDPVRLAIILNNPAIVKRLPPSLVPDETAGRLNPLCKALLVSSHLLLISGFLLFGVSLAIRDAGNGGKP